MTAGITLNGSAILDRTVNGRSSRREGYPPGNRAVWPDAPSVDNYRGPTVVPHNAYRTRGGGYNDWCVIACYSDEEWGSLVRLIGSPDWATDARLGSLPGRIRRQEELDDGIESWTLTMDKYELTAACQAAGVRAMPVQSSEDRVEHDPQLKKRGMYTEMAHPVVGTRKVQNAPFRFSKSTVDIHSPAPLIGQHTVEVMGDLLGLSREEVLAGYDDGTFWPTGMQRFDYVEETLR